jgi:hypothetical protein
MMKTMLKLGFFLMVLTSVAVPAMADLVTFNTSSGGVNFSVNDGGFWVTSSQIQPGLSSPGL